MPDPFERLPQSGNENPSQIVQQAIEYLQFRYCLASNTELANELAKHLFGSTSALPRQAAFEALKALVKWAAFSHFRYENPALKELQALREVYGNDERERVLDLVADVLVACDHLKEHLGFVVSMSVEEELQKLPSAGPDAQQTSTALYDLELDEFWGFELLQRHAELGLEEASVSTPLDIFFEPHPVIGEETAVSEPKPEATKAPSLSKVYKLKPAPGSTPDPLLQMLMGDEG